MGAASCVADRRSGPYTRCTGRCGADSTSPRVLHHVRAFSTGRIDASPASSGAGPRLRLGEISVELRDDLQHELGDLLEDTAELIAVVLEREGFDGGRVLVTCLVEADELGHQPWERL